jgi:hypothetical protein
MQYPAVKVWDFCQSLKFRYFLLASLILIYYHGCCLFRPALRPSSIPFGSPLHKTWRFAPPTFYTKSEWFRLARYEEANFNSSTR